MRLGSVACGRRVRRKRALVILKMCFFSCAGVRSLWLRGKMYLRRALPLRWREAILCSSWVSRKGRKGDGDTKDSLFESVVLERAEMSSRLRRASCSMGWRELVRERRMRSAAMESSRRRRWAFLVRRRAREKISPLMPLFHPSGPRALSSARRRVNVSVGGSRPALTAEP